MRFQDIYNEEEGNYGKLLRLWQQGFEYRPPNSDLLSITEKDYTQFKSEVVTKGFEILAFQLLPEISKTESINPLTSEDGSFVGYKSGENAFTSASNVKTKDLQKLMITSNLVNLWHFSEKYQWKKYNCSNGIFKLSGNGKKPKSILMDHLSN